MCVMVLQMYIIVLHHYSVVWCVYIVYAGHVFCLRVSGRETLYRLCADFHYVFTPPLEWETPVYVL